MSRSHCGALASLELAYVNQASLTHGAPTPCLSSAEWAILVLHIFSLWGWFWTSQLRQVSNLLFEPTLQPFLPSSRLFLASSLSDTVFLHSKLPTISQQTCLSFPGAGTAGTLQHLLCAVLGL